MHNMYASLLWLMCTFVQKHAELLEQLCQCTWVHMQKLECADLI
jgi:hypothetical protein